MKCGVGVVFLNHRDIERVAAEDWSRPPTVADADIWDDSLRLGDLAEPLGFDSIWSSEHLASPYGMCPNTLMHLSYWAGRTERIALGTHVVVLPWHHPVQVVHEIAMLDILLQGRDLTIGVGRGLSPKEFAALGIPQDQARARFLESIDIIRLGLSTERFSYAGEIFQIPEMSVRPQPRNRALMDNAVAAFMTPDSRDAVARTGLGSIVVAGQSFEQVAADMAQFNEVRASAGHPGAVQPIVYLWAYCVEKEQDVEAAYAPLATLSAAGAHHYGFGDPSAFAKMPGYEQYADVIAAQKSSGPAANPIGPHLIGTPDQIIAKAQDLQRVTGAREVITLFNFGGALACEEAERSMRLFAREVLPAIHDIPTGATHSLAMSTSVASAG